jgi:RNA polymerase sigma factor (TIGR02999 family)
VLCDTNERVRSGREAVDDILPLVYDELRRAAVRQLRREREGHPLEPAALVHEVYLELVSQRDLSWRDRSDFLGIASYLMRQVLVRHARRQRAGKRAAVRVPLDAERHGRPVCDLDARLLGDALAALAETDPRLARVVELRFFAGLTIEEAAEALGVGTATVEREWRAAREWLRRELGFPRADAGIRSGPEGCRPIAGGTRSARTGCSRTVTRTLTPTPS